MINTIEKNNYYSYYGQHNLSFKSLTAADICSKLCKGGCCDHSTVLPMSLKKATDRLMGEYFKNNLANRATLPLKRIVYSWGLNSQNINALNIFNTGTELWFYYIFARFAIANCKGYTLLTIRAQI